MSLILVFALTLFVAALLSDAAQRSILSTTVLFLAAGVIVGPGLHVVETAPGDALVGKFSEFALFAVLFTDGMRVDRREVVAEWQLPVRALVVGLPLTFIGTALLARGVANVPWDQAFLLGAILSPTDPVFAAALIGHESVPLRLRRLLNLESGLNDGLALPLVVTLLAVAGSGSFEPAKLAGQVALGCALGLAIPWLAVQVERVPILAATALFEPLLPFSIGLVVLGVSSVTHANEFLAGFAGGFAVATFGPHLKETFERFGELVAELLKLGAVLVFGTLLSWQVLGDISWQGYLFVFFSVFAVRPLVLNVALIRSDLTWPERMAASWFGPKGFASIVFGLLMLNAGIPQGIHLFHLAAAVIATSIVVHSSTDVIIADWFKRLDARAQASMSESV